MTHAEVCELDLDEVDWWIERLDEERKREAEAIRRNTKG